MFGSDCLALLVLKERELRKLLILTLITAYFFGLLGLFVLACMEWLTRARYANDIVAKHGIGHQDASRLGGAVIVFSSAGGVVLSVALGVNQLEFWSYLWSWVAIILCGALGLVEDFDNNFLTPRFRLICLAAIFSLLFSQYPWLIPSELGFEWLSSLMQLPVIGVILAVIFAVGFINAVNMADGANGLMPGIIFITCTIFQQLSGTFSWVWGILAFVTGVFLLFNIVSGRLFLGDGGAYALGSLMVIGSFSGVNNGHLSIGFLAVLFAYPCLEIVISMIRRIASGRSPFLPDNDHFHNRLHHFLQSRVTSQVLANSGTGLLITAMTSGVAFYGYYFEWLHVMDGKWWTVFAMIAVLHLSCFYLLGRAESRVTQFVVGSR